jgi:hypothetical protein
VISTSVTSALQELLEDFARRSSLGDAARNMLQENAGATEKVLQIIERMSMAHNSGIRVAG